MLILGIDPGSVVTGYGFVHSGPGRCRLVDSGVIRPDSKLPFEKRLLQIYDDLLCLIAQRPPDEVALESVFHGKNVQTMMKMCHARGVILLAVVNSALPVCEYTPTQVKRSVVGRGSASKEQVRFMIQQILGLPKVEGPPDVSDALALAICHSHRGGLDLPDARRSRNLEEKLRQMGAFDRGHKLPAPLAGLKGRVRGRRTAAT